ncbi:2-keto-4-pentenoate hydratase [Herbaspirillum sp. RV1423]|uniref:2-keto-4-pentenoate hydratase n=1 Tax=Herbaspirillum sp. RV1423 TaxID=1443993 RepID=UPI0004B68CE1|nr:2-keto-4-pentenoate hydratase [Herbaspirillum sp. RV1423]
MDTQKIKAAADLLLAARNRKITLARLPDECIPADAEEAYAVQDLVSQALGPVGGWKVGAKAPGAQPSCAPMPAQFVFAAPYHFFDLLTAGSRGIEVEIALRMKHDLPPRSRPYTQEEVVAAVATVHPAIELVSSRYTDYPARDPLAGLADALSNCAFIYGPGRSDLGQIDQSIQHAELYFNGLEVARTVGGNPVVDIWPLAVWLANHVGARCGGLKAGQFITTGSCTGLLFAEKGSSVNALLENIGKVDISFAQE